MEETTFAENRFSLKEPLSLSLLLGSESDGHRSNGKKKKGRERGTRSYFSSLETLGTGCEGGQGCFSPIQG